MLSRTLAIGTFAAAALAFAGCKTADHHDHSGHDHGHDTKAVAKAVAHLNPTAGNNAKGTVTFTPDSKGTRVVAHLTGLTPGAHGFHIHEKGDCSAPDASSAGGHFNPGGMPHAGPDSAQRHVGDLGNITADASGVAHYEIVVNGIEFDGAASIIGRGLIVHAKADDLKSQPSGDAGGRVACGVIEKK